jgi:hypothetical protein
MAANARPPVPGDVEADVELGSAMTWRREASAGASPSWRAIRAARVVTVTLLLVAASCAPGADRSAVTSPSEAPTPSLPPAAVSGSPTAPAKNAAGGIADYLSCGTVIPNSIRSGEGSGPTTVQLASPTGVAIARFAWDSGQAALGTYVCARLIPAAPMSGLAAIVGPGAPGYVTQSVAATDSCGSVTGYAADGAQMLITLTADGRATAYRLEYRFAGDAAPTDIGSRLAAKSPQLLLITGRQAQPDGGSPNAINLRDSYVARVPSCTPLGSVTPQPTGFRLPLGCAAIDQPAVGADQTRWKFDCGWASHDARGTLAPALVAQGWTSCGAVTATAAWAKGPTRLEVGEGAGGFAGYPQLVQPRAGIQNACP